MPATVKRTPSSNPLYIGFKMTGLTIKIFWLSLKRKRDRILDGIEEWQPQKIKYQK